jgi:tetratricopeptide (TPR) repeat protein
MAAKNKKPGPGVARATGSSQEVERLIAKLRLKDAVHAAKLCYKSESTPEHHRLLERAYLLRADQLRRGGMPAAAQEVAQHLLDFGVTDPTLVEQAAGLLMALGMTRGALALQGRLDTPEARGLLAGQEADLAVLHPERATTVPPELRAGAETVRAALAALQSGNEAAATDALRDVARSSPWSDWKLFIRGLAAFSRREVDVTRANWDRLDPKRAPTRIARSLMAISSGAGGEPNAPIKLVALEKQVFGEPLLETFEQLGTLLARNRWRDALRRLAWLRPRLVRIDPMLAERLTSVLLDPLLGTVRELEYDEAQELTDGFMQAAEPLAIDPHWNRLQALIWQRIPGGLEVVEEYWRAYLQDLETLPCFTTEERRLAQALVWEHLGDEIMDSTEPGSGPAHFGRHRRGGVDDEDPKVKDRAIACFEQSLQLVPDHIPAYRALLEVHCDRGQREKAAAVARRLLDHFPDDFGALSFLVSHHLSREEPEPALEFVCRARKLKPLDMETARDEFAVRVLHARMLALHGRWDEGRAELAAGGLAWPEGARGLHYQARRAIFELKAGQTERGEALILEFLDGLTEATPLWLALLIEAIRYKLPKADQARFEARWANLQCKKVRADTAGALAELMTPFVAADVDYPGRDAHVMQVTGYLLRATRVKYRLSDLIAVCTFLNLIPSKRDLYIKMVERGKKLFPDAPRFHAMAGSIAMEKGPFSGGLGRARESFERALSLAERSEDPRDAALVPPIQQQLSLIRDLEAGLRNMPFGAFGGGSFSFSGKPPSFSEVLDAIQREIGGDWYDDDDEEEDDRDDYFGDDEAPSSQRPFFGGYSIPRSEPKPKPRSNAKPKPKPKKG